MYLNRYSSRQNCKFQRYDACHNYCIIPNVISKFSVKSVFTLFTETIKITIVTIYLLCFRLKAYWFDHMSKLWSRAQFEHRLIVLSFTLWLFVKSGSESSHLQLLHKQTTIVNRYCTWSHWNEYFGIACRASKFLFKIFLNQLIFLHFLM